MSKITTLWAVFFRDHIHMSEDKTLAVFRRRADAEAWVKEYGLMEPLRVRKLGQIDEAKRLAAK